ncbi:sesquipedalian-1 [Microcaecilia unicolor]|uniref:Sesquipedalian n=1 Tax=Microcaecilia unicolor TaxID=1415580 RepID=A0A6P7ZEY1_9AMPH|nr:sesquipedalian-1 [Microcaecilia unicolor]
MKVNERSLVHYATCESPADNSGFLYKRGEHNTAYHRRWFVLKGNVLFYFEDKGSREPVGAIIMEGCTVEPSESAEQYIFTIRFEGSKSRTYILVAESEATMQSWVKSLSRANFDYMRLVIKELQLQVEDMEQYVAASYRLQGGAAITKEKPDSKSSTFSQDTHHQSYEKSVLVGSAIKENGCAVWNNSHTSVHLPNGCDGDTNQGNVRRYSGGGHRPPPVPPRRSLPSRNIAGVAGLSALTLESPVSLGTVRFSKLHDWYGQEVDELKIDWVERRRSSEQ